MTPPPQVKVKLMICPHLISILLLFHHTPCSLWGVLKQLKVICYCIYNVSYLVCEWNKHDFACQETNTGLYYPHRHLSYFHFGLHSVFFFFKRENNNNHTKPLEMKTNNGLLKWLLVGIYFIIFIDRIEIFLNQYTLQCFGIDQYSFLDTSLAWSF